MGIAWNRPYEPMVGNPDDHRPQTVWRVVIDPDRADESAVVGMAVLMERCAGGDRIPLHRHDVDEVVFIPAGMIHGTVNAGEIPLHVHAVFPSRRVRMEMLDRNPAPGTEGEPPMTTVYDFATGEVVVIGPTGP